MKMQHTWDTAYYVLSIWSLLKYKCLFNSTKKYQYRTVGNNCLSSFILLIRFTPLLVVTDSLQWPDIMRLEYLDMDIASKIDNGYTNDFGFLTNHDRWFKMYRRNHIHVSDLNAWKLSPFSVETQTVFDKPECISVSYVLWL